MLNDTHYDAEFQLISKDFSGQTSYCTSGNAALSLLIKIDDSQTDDWFSSWVGKTDFKLDLNDLLSKFAGLNHNFVGYKGGDTMPDCIDMCWFVITEPFYIKQSTFDALQAATPGVEWNNRILDDKRNVPPTLYYLAKNKNAPDVKPAPSAQTDL